VKIVVVNWQDRENPQAGGAEQHLHEIFGRLAARGHEVTLLCGGWPGCASEASLDGMRVLRVGTRYTFPFLVRRAWRERGPSLAADVLVEDINKVPLHAAQWAGVPPVVAVVPHLFGSTAFKEAPWPLAAAVWLAERSIPRAYRGIPFEAISESTADDLASRGIPRESVRVIYCGIDSVRFTPDAAARAAQPTFAYLGRLRRYKGVDLVIRAFAAMQSSAATLEIAGTGDDRPRLERLVASLDLGRRVRFLGFVSEADKRALLRRAWGLAFASPKEGWGITNLEAAACGTPVVASDSPGLRESVRNEETGFLVPHGDVGAMAAALDRLAGSPALVASLGARGRQFAETFTWERSALETEAHLEAVVRQQGRRR
jgi:glycosyltransferase involved in cell wall biosynthesis